MMIHYERLDERSVSRVDEVKLALRLDDVDLSLGVSII